jgi:hypothetical protein
MHRKSMPEDPRLEALLDERDHLQIQLSLERDKSPPDEERIKDLRQAVSNAESRIRYYYPES